MEAEQKALLSFINLHAKKAKLTKDRCIYLTDFVEAGIPLNTPLTSMTLDDVLEAFDTASPLVQWVLKQISTYDVDKEVLVGLKFSKQTVLAHALRLIPDD